MKLTIENVWRGAHGHHGESLHRRRIDMWPLRLTTRHASEHDELPKAPSCYPTSMLKVFDEALRRCPSVSMDTEIMEGQPCIDGTRIPIRSVLRALELQGSIKGVLKCYPQLGEQQVKDALYFVQVVLELPSGLDETTIAH